MDKDLNAYTLKDFQSFEYQSYNGKTVSDIIIVPLNRKHRSKYRCMKFILLHETREICGVLGGGSDILHMDGRRKGVIYYRIDCLFKSKCVRVMLPNITLTPYELTISSEFHIGG